jgi:hypothetical protein
MIENLTILSDDEIRFISDEASLIRGGCIVNIGSWRSSFAIALAQGLKKRANYLKSKLFCIDANPIYHLNNIYPGLKNPELFDIDSADPTRLLNLDSQYAARGIPDQIGILALDGRLPLDEVRDSIRIWRPLLRPGAKILFIDASAIDKCSEVARSDLISSGEFRHISTVGKISLLEETTPSFYEESSLSFRTNKVAFCRKARLSNLNLKFAIDRIQYGSFVSRKHKIVYIETPKAACTSLKNLMSEIEGVYFKPLHKKPYYMETKLNMLIHQRKYVNIPHLFQLEQQEFTSIFNGNSDWFRFGVSRNPFSRLFSFYVNKLLLQEPGDLSVYNMFGKVNSAQEIHKDFSEFVAFTFDNFDTLSQWEYHLARQVDVLLIRLLSFDQIFKIENLDLLSDALSKRTGIHGLKIPHNNRAIIKDWHIFYDLKSIEMVKKMYAPDFDLLGYDTNSCKEKKEQGSISSNFHIDFNMIKEIRLRNEMIKHLYSMIL